MRTIHSNSPLFDWEILSAHGAGGSEGVIYQVTQLTQEETYRNTRLGCVSSEDKDKNKQNNNARDTITCERAATVACDGGPSPSTVHGAPLTTECWRCEDGIAFNGNNPSGGMVCEVCDGTGVLELCCALCGEYGATDRIGNEVYHLSCAEEVLADMHRVLERVA